MALVSPHRCIPLMSTVRYRCLQTEGRRLRALCDSLERMAEDQRRRAEQAERERDEARADAQNDYRALWEADHAENERMRAALVRAGDRLMLAAGIVGKTEDRVALAGWAEEARFGWQDAPSQPAQAQR